MKDEKEKLDGSEKLANGISAFIEEHRVLILVIATVLICALVVFVFAANAAEKKENALQVKVDSLQRSYENLLYQADADEELRLLAADLAEVADQGGSKYSGIKASYVQGLVLMTVEDYAQAYDAFVVVYEKAPTSYLAPLAMFNAAVAKEDLGNTDEAIALYERITHDFGYDVSVAPRALFSSARLHQAKGDIELARSTYQQIVDQYTNNGSQLSEYVALSRNALITL